MNVLVINSSPKVMYGNTAVILNAFLKGISEAGGIVNKIYLYKLAINPCKGDLRCWFRNKGICIQHDDMPLIIQSIRNADIIVFSTPVYCDGVPGNLKIMMDRMVVMGNPYLENRDNRTRHPFPPGYQQKKFVLISSCGLWEIENFSPMISHLNAFCRNIGFHFCGALLRPHSLAMKNNDLTDILQAAKIAGHQIIENDSISPALEDTVRRELVSREKYIEDINKKVSETLL